MGKYSHHEVLSWLPATSRKSRSYISGVESPPLAVGFIDTRHGAIKSISLFDSELDRIIFTPSEVGKLTTRDFIATTRPRQVERTWAKWIWSKSLPLNISAFL